MKSQKQKLAALLAAIAGVGGLWCGAAQAQGASAFSQSQLDAGRDEFQSNCAECHKADLTGQTIPAVPALVGKKFTDDWGSHTVGELYAFVQSSMPKCEGGVLGNSTYADVVAFVLWANGASPGASDLTPTTAVKVGDIVGAPRKTLGK